MTRASAFMSLAMLVFGCGLEEETEKPKVVLSEELGTTFDAIEPTGGGSWALVQLIESPHPYDNSFARTWDVRGQASAPEMHIVFESFKTERGYDWVTVSDSANGQETRWSGEEGGREIVVRGNAVRIVMTTDHSITDTGFRIRIEQAVPCTCTNVSSPVCGVDGRTYDNACRAQCAGVAVASTGACGGSSEWIAVRHTLESAHPYADNSRLTWTIREPGARQLRAHFARVNVERGYDFVRVLDASGRLVASYSGDQSNVQTPAIAGDAFTVELVSDGSITAWGFALDGYDAIGGCTTNAECGTGQRCVQVQCVRAPCFKVCQADGGSAYTLVPLDQLDRNPLAWDGRQVRVTAEPHLGTSRCTRRACGTSNPCCNACSAEFEIGHGIRIADAAGKGQACQGNECDPDAVGCERFRSSAPGRYEMEGRFVLESTGTKTLRVDNVRAVDCQRGGCSGSVCGNAPNVVTSCEWRSEYACYATASCGVQGDGHCAWTDTPTLRQCLASSTPAPARFASTDTPLDIPDNQASGITSLIDVPSRGALRSLAVSVTIRHTYRGDLDIALIHPDGTEFVLQSRSGGSQHDYVVLGLEVPSFVGKAATGRWRLRVRDLAQADTGVLSAWSLDLL